MTARFSAEEPLTKAIWQKWLQESYELACGGKAQVAKKKAEK
ncbi:MAG: hypothetical protein ABIP94_11590 [Planctomycetota bacterium]